MGLFKMTRSTSGNEDDLRLRLVALPWQRGGDSLRCWPHALRGTLGGSRKSRLGDKDADGQQVGRALIQRE